MVNVMGTQPLGFGRAWRIRFEDQREHLPGDNTLTDSQTNAVIDTLMGTDKSPEAARIRVALTALDPDYKHSAFAFRNRDDFGNAYSGAHGLTSHDVVLITGSKNDRQLRQLRKFHKLGIESHQADPNETTRFRELFTSAIRRQTLGEGQLVFESEGDDRYPDMDELTYLKSMKHEPPTLDTKG